MTDIFEDTFNYEEYQIKDDESYEEFRAVQEQSKERRRILEEKGALHECDYPYVNCPICHEYFSV